MIKRKKTLLFLFLVVLLGVYFGYKYIYKEHRDIANEEVTYALKLADLDSAYSVDVDNANTKFLDQTIAVSGIVTTIDKNNNSAMLDGKINCNFQDVKNISLNSSIIVKGRFIGYDELLEEYRLDECTISKQ